MHNLAPLRYPVDSPVERVGVPRMTVCSATGCPELCPVGESRCPEHARPAWSNPSQHTLQRPRNWKAIRARVLRRDGHRCRMCGQPGAEVDHIVPVSKGGSWEAANLQTLCRPHHIAKTRNERRSA